MGDGEAPRRLTVSDLGEKRIIREIVKPLNPDADSLVGIGDDAAVVKFPTGSDLVISCDKIPEDLLAIQFGLMDAHHHGRYLAMVNLSDIAAMGAKPLGLLLTLALPADFDLDYLREFVAGFHAGGAEWDARVVGGDTGWGSVLCLSATAFGTIEGEPLRRSGARAGDELFVTGPVGGFGTALAYFGVARPRGLLLGAADEAWLLDRLIRPQARVAIGLELKRLGVCTSCIDITDGFGQSLREIADASCVGLEVRWSDLPLHRTTLEVAAFLERPPQDLVFGIGLDLELVGTLRDRSIVADAGLFVIGRAIEEEGVVYEKDGRRTAVTTPGWQHFRLPALELLRRMYASEEASDAPSSSPN